MRAVYNATAEARRLALQTQRPILIEVCRLRRMFVIGTPVEHITNTLAL